MKGVNLLDKFCQLATILQVNSFQIVHKFVDLNISNAQVLKGDVSPSNITENSGVVWLFYKKYIKLTR